MKIFQFFGITLLDPCRGRHIGGYTEKKNKKVQIYQISPGRCYRVTKALRNLNRVYCMFEE